MSSIYDDPRSRSEQKPFGSSEAVYNAEPYAPPGSGPVSEPPVKKKSGCGCVGCLLGCLGMSVVVAAVAGFGVWYAFKKLPDLARQGIAQAVQESELTPEDKQMVMQQVDRLVDGYKQGKINVEDLAEFGEDFMTSPLMDLLIAFGARVQYIEKSGLSDEEKAEAEKTLHRVARGVIEEKISQDDLDIALNHISNEMPNGGRQFKEEVSDTELRAFLSECKRLADEAMISNEELKVDVGSELKKLVDRALGEGPPAEMPDPMPQEKSEPPAPTPEAAPPTAEAPDPNAPKTE